MVQLQQSSHALAPFRFVSVVLLLVALASWTQMQAWGDRCAVLANLNVPSILNVHAELMAAGNFTTPQNERILSLPPFCRVTLTLTPSPDSEIHAEVWLPEAGWNGRMEGTGNGGFAGSISYPSLAAGLQRGFATVNSDMGMAPPPNATASAFVDRPERWADWGYRSTHEMTIAAKHIIRAYYGHDPDRAYFAGCSTGGEQALMEAQRYPQDYDGIVAGAPANNRTGVHVSILWNFAVTRRSPSAVLSASQISLLGSKVLSACDMLDGVADGVIANPQDCSFDPGVLECKAGKPTECLTSEQVVTVRRIYAGPSNPRTGQSLYPGVPKGSEAAWAQFGPPSTSEQVPPFKPIFQWVFGLDWNWRDFDFDSHFAQMNARLGDALNAVSPNLSTFRDLGHKLIVYHGWADSLVPPEESIEYYRAVRRLEAARGDDDKKTEEFYRLFMVPGMGHCGGGSGADQFEALESAVAWVEHGIKPDRILATGTRKSPGPSTFQRILCPYPQQARYDGSGNVNQAASFSCIESR